MVAAVPDIGPDRAVADDRALLMQFLAGDLSESAIAELEERLDEEPELQCLLGELAKAAFTEDLLDRGATRVSLLGAPMPEGADAVIRYEDLEITDGAAKIMLDKVKLEQNVHKQGEDRDRRGRTDRV